MQGSRGNKMATEPDFLRKGGGKLSTAARSSSSVPLAPPEPTAYTAPHPTHARTLHFQPSPSPPRNHQQQQQQQHHLTSPPHGATVGAGRDSLNDSVEEGGTFSEFIGELGKTHARMSQIAGPLGGGGAATAWASAVRASSPPPSSVRPTTAPTVRSPQVDFSPVMQALEVKLAKMTQENIALKTERESSQRAFMEEISRMHIQKEADIVQAKKAQEDELKRLRDQVRLMDRKQRAVSKHTEQRKERAEIDNLLRELQKCRTEAAARDSTWRITVDKLKTTIADLTQKNSELEEQYKHLSDTLRRHAESDWDAERSALQDQCDALTIRNRELEMLLADEREVNSVLSRLQKDARRTASPAAPERPSSSHRSPSARSSSADLAQSAEQLRQASQELRSQAQSQRSPQTRTAWHDQNSRPHQAWTDPKPAAAASASDMMSRIPTVVSERRLDNGGVEQLRADGSKVITYRNGTTKEQSADGKLTVRFANGDVKEVAVDGTSTYFYREARTTHITYPGGVQLVHFPNNQMEKHFPDGTKEIVFPNKVRKKIFTDGREEYFDA